MFTPRERQSLYQVMCAVRQIGKHHLEQKLQHIHEVMSITGITPTDVAQSRALTEPQMISILKQMSDTKKLYFAKFISMTALIGGCTENESKFSNWIISEIEVPTDF